MIYEVAMISEVDETAKRHLLQHFQGNVRQEDLCFALWRPSTGRDRSTALIFDIILPQTNERTLHGDVSFNPGYMARAIAEARKQHAGLAFMHSHPSPGWQQLSMEDTTAEQDVLAYPAGATNLPLVGLTIGNDGYWSARFWLEQEEGMRLRWCEKVRIIGTKSFPLHFNDEALPPQPRREILKRTYDTWGTKNQDNISRLHVGIVGLGSVGSIVAEAMARIGIGRLTLVDPDWVKEHNLDRLLYGTVQDIGDPKVDIAEKKLRQSATSDRIRIISISKSIHSAPAYDAVLDCDVIFSCVDRPMARDVLNHIAYAHLIPVFDCGIEVLPDRVRDDLFAAHWRAYLITPHHQCLRCNGQYDTSQVVMELDGSLDKPTYVTNLSPEARSGNQNVFPFSLAVAGMTVNQMLKYIIGPDWWPSTPQEHYQYMTGQIEISKGECHPNCPFRNRKAKGDIVYPHYILRDV